MSSHYVTDVNCRLKVGDNKIDKKRETEPKNKYIFEENRLNSRRKMPWLSQWRLERKCTIQGFGGQIIPEKTDIHTMPLSFIISILATGELDFSIITWNHLPTLLSSASARHFLCSVCTTRCESCQCATRISLFTLSRSWAIFVFSKKRHIVSHKYYYKSVTKKIFAGIVYL